MQNSRQEASENKFTPPHQRPQNNHRSKLIKENVTQLSRIIQDRKRSIQNNKFSLSHNNRQNNYHNNRQNNYHQHFSISIKTNLSFSNMHSSQQQYTVYINKELEGQVLENKKYQPILIINPSKNSSNSKQIDKSFTPIKLQNQKVKVINNDPIDSHNINHRLQNLSQNLKNQQQLQIKYTQIHNTPKTALKEIISSKYEECQQINQSIQKASKQPKQNIWNKNSITNRKNIEPRTKNTKQCRNQQQINNATKIRNTILAKIKQNNHLPRDHLFKATFQTPITQSLSPKCRQVIRRLYSSKQRIIQCSKYLKHIQINKKERFYKMYQNYRLSQKILSSKQVSDLYDIIDKELVGQQEWGERILNKIYLKLKRMRK